MTDKKPTCGRCGVYRHLHPVKWCKGYRHSFWWDRHYLGRHVGAWLWIHALTTHSRDRIAWRMSINAGGWRCYCDLYDSVYKANDWATWRGDYNCLCEFPLPWDASAPGNCYCAPPSLTVDGAA